MSKNNIITLEDYNNNSKKFFYLNDIKKSLKKYKLADTKLLKQKKKVLQQLLFDYFDNLNEIDPDTVPSPEVLDDIWFYFNYRVNFFRLLGENRTAKFEQGIKWMTYLHNLSAPDNAFIMYYLGLLQHRLYGKVAPVLIKKLDTRLKVSSYWRERFAIFGLSVDHVKRGEFPLSIDDENIKWHLPELFCPTYLSS